MDIIKSLNTRYATKKFDSSKKLTEEQINQLEDLLQLAPSSTNLQPWHFVLATTEEGKARVAKGATGFYAFNQDKVLDAGAVVVFASQVELSEEFLRTVLEQEDQDGRFPKSEFKEQNHLGRKNFAEIHKFDLKDYQHWVDKQVYLNVGSFLLGVAALGLDAAPMEGFKLKVLDEEFGLREKGYTSLVVVAVGYHKESDFNRALPKSRLSKEVLIEKV